MKRGWRITTWMPGLLRVQPGEGAALRWAFALFFCLLCGYYVLRPVRDEMGITGGVEQLQWAFTGTFLATLAVVPLFGALSARLPRRRLLPAVYLFFIVNLLLFYGLFQGRLLEATWVARAFFIWVSVFNLFVVSVFWSFMTDLFDNEQARRLFGVIAAGGSAGAVTGPALTTALAGTLGPVRLLLVAAAFLALALLCVERLLRLAPGLRRGAADETAEADSAPLGGGAWAGIGLALRSPYLLGICLYLLLFTTLSTFLYFEQAHIVRASSTDPATRTALFAAMDLAVNLLTLATQLLLTGRIVLRVGLPVVLAAVPALVAVGLLALALAPTLAVLVTLQVLRRAANFGFTRPAREVLFTLVGREARYKAKSFIDTVVYRGGDALSGWLFAGLTAAGLGLSAIALVGIPLALAWLYVGAALGRRHERLREQPVAARE